MSNTLSSSQPLQHERFWERLTSIFHPTLAQDQLKDPEMSFGIKRTELVLATLVVNLLGLGLPIITLQVYDRILVSDSLDTLHVLAAGLCIVICLEGALRLARSYVINWAGATYEHIIACNSMRHMLSADLATIEKQGTGEQLQRMNAIGKLQDFFSGQVLITMIDLPFVLIFIGLIAYLAGPLVIVPLVMLMIFGCVAWHLGRKLKKTLHKRDEIDEKRTSFIIEVLNGIHTVKSLGLESIFQRRYEQLQTDSSMSHYHVAKDGNAASNYGMLFTQAMMIGMISFGTPMAMTGQLTLGTLIACVMLSGRIMNPMKRALSVWARFQDFNLAKHDVSKTFELPLLERCTQEEFGEKQGRLDIEDISFSYGEGEPNILHELSLNLKRGQSISISGDHSSGKTTLLKLIAGLYQPDQGQLALNGVPATQYPSHELIHHVGYMAMEGTIFRGTVRDNLTAFGVIPSHTLHEVTKLLGLDQEISKLPAGYETKLEGTTADPIPPGLKQRIAIARTLGTKPRLLLFDNADRALDKEGYNQLYRLLGRLKGKVTMVIVTDDRNILRLAQKEYVLADGKLTERAYADDSKMHDVLPYQELRL